MASRRRTRKSICQSGRGNSHGRKGSLRRCDWTASLISHLKKIGQPATLLLQGGPPPPNQIWRRNSKDIPDCTNSYLISRFHSTNHSSMTKHPHTKIYGEGLIVASDRMMYINPLAPLSKRFLRRVDHPTLPLLECQMSKNERSVP